MSIQHWPPLFFRNKETFSESLSPQWAILDHLSSKFIRRLNLSNSWMLSQILCESASYHDIQLLPSTIVCDLNFTDLRLLCLWLLISLLLICLSCMPILLHNFDVLWASFQCESLPSIYDNHDNHYFFVSSQTFFNFLLRLSLAPQGIHFPLWDAKNLHPL